MIKLMLAAVLTVTLLHAEKIHVTDNDRCLIRQFEVAKYPQWVAKVVTVQNKNVYFSSPKSMFEYLFGASRWPELGALNRNDMKSILVTDFKTGHAIDATRAYYVYGSNQVSPGGDDLVPFASKSDAEDFMKRRHGARVLSFSKITPALVNLINGRI